MVLVKLYIAEKPSLGRAIADVLPKPHRKGDGCIWVGDGDCVSWCIGHLLEQAEPHVYDPAYKKWALQHLPIIPEQWKLQPKSNTRKQLTVLKSLVKQAQQIVHAGDPDREGQLLVDEVISFLGVNGSKKQSIQRLLINDLNPAAVRRALGQLRENREFIPLSTSALARSRADWLYGINLTRACTLQGRKVGYEGVLSVGRVQTPVLGLVVRRDQDIENFVSKPFYEVLALLEVPAKPGQPAETFKAKWQPSEACLPYQDEEGRVLSKALADNVVKRISGQPAEVTAVKQQPRRQAPPLPYSLSALQIDAGKRYGLSAQQVLDGCQALYERHKLITYPRSDSRYLPLEQHTQASAVLSAVAEVANSLDRAVTGANTELKSKAWNDKKVDAHHAIIPTAKKIDSSKLSREELRLYELIARQYLMQFYPDHLYSETRVDVIIAGGCFRASAKVIQALGWKILYEQDKAGRKENEIPRYSKVVIQQDTTKSDTKTEINADAVFAVDHLPALEVGQILKCLQGECIEKNTQPPKAFTDATLLAAMTGIARYVTDAEVRKVLKETDGLGTEATRAGIIELLFKRGFLVRHNKQIRATDAGKGLINSLPVSSTTPDMTARWESMLNAMVDKQAGYGDFMGSMLPSLTALIDESCATLPVALQGVKSNAKWNSRSKLKSSEKLKSNVRSKKKQSK